MKKLSVFYRHHSFQIYLFVGFLLSCIFMLPYLLLGTGSVVTYHDQLDGELLNYILAAKYLFTNVRIYPEILDGLPATGAIPPAPLFVLLFKIFTPFTSFLWMQWLICLVGFLGMYLLTVRLTGQHFVSFSIAVVFMLLPFYPVYGMCIPGQPLLVYCLICLYRDHISVLKRVGLYVLIFLYGLSSSFILVGFACLFVLGMSALILSVRNRRPQLWGALFTLFAGYLLTNAPLFLQIFVPQSGYESHKAEMIFTPIAFRDCISLSFSTDMAYIQTWPSILLLPAVFLLLLLGWSLLKRQSIPSELRRNLLAVLKVFGFILSVCAVYAFYNGDWYTVLRNSSHSAIKAFNFGRVTWLLPTAWCILAGYLLSAICQTAKGKCRTILHYSIVLITLSVWSIVILFHSPVKANVAKLVKGVENYYALDWNRFYATDIFEQIDAAIGKPREDYRVVSVGIYPAAAAYNGFYCLDGYSNNYPLTYKHSFREIIESELTKSDYIRAYFDNWGNRCYITTSELPNYYTFEKKWNTVISELSLNIRKLQEMNCQYIFSAAYLSNAEELGLTLVQEAPFETETSWYHLYVYELPR